MYVECILFGMYRATLHAEMQPDASGYGDVTPLITIIVRVARTVAAPPCSTTDTPPTPAVHPTPPRQRQPPHNAACCGSGAMHMLAQRVPPRRRSRIRDAGLIASGGVAAKASAGVAGATGAGVCPRTRSRRRLMARVWRALHAMQSCISTCARNESRRGGGAGDRTPCRKRASQAIAARLARACVACTACNATTA